MVSEQEKTEDNDWRIPLADVVTRLNDFGKANRSFRVADDESEHKADFLSDPDHQQWPQKHYPKLDQTDFTSALDELRQIREAFVDSDVPEKYLPVYLARVDEKISFIQLMSYAKQFHDDPNDLNIVERFRRQNIELYGSPDRQTYETLLSGKLRIIRDKDLTGEAARIRDELLAEFSDLDIDNQPPEYEPKSETFQWIHDVVENLFAQLYAQIPDLPDDYEFSDDEIRRISQDIIDQLGDEGYRAITKPNITAFDVNTPAREFQIPPTEKRVRGKITPKVFREIIVPHEIGRHMMSSIMGRQYDLLVLETGLAGAGGTEEGIAKVMQQAAGDEFRGFTDPSKMYYIICGLSEFAKQNPTEIFATVSKLEALMAAEPGAETLDLAAAQEKVYGSEQRVFSATDALPIYSVLAYYEDEKKIWQYLDSIVDTPWRDELFARMLSGRRDPTNLEHEKIFNGSGISLNYGAPEPEIALTDKEKLQLRQVAGKFVVDHELLDHGLK